jgi:hypothetical protein
MGQIYMQKFEYRGAPTKAEFDGAWGVALEAFAKTGNFGGVESGIQHIKTYGTAWGGYVLVEVDDSEAFSRYQAYHAQNYSHIAHITMEPVFDLDATLQRR